MTPEIQKLEDTITKVHRVGFPPKFKESFKTKLSKGAFIAIALKVIEKLEWDLIYYDDNTIEAKRKNRRDSWSEGISMTFDFGKVNIQSSSLGNETWDYGRNSKRVKLFQIVLNDLETELSNLDIREIEFEQKKVDEWEDYEIPETLPASSPQKNHNFYIPLIGTISIALLLGYILAILNVNGFYIIGLFDLGTGFILGFILSITLKFGNYTNFNKLRLVLIASLAVSFVSWQVFTWQIIVTKNDILNLDFISYIQLRLEAGLTIKTLNTGWIGLVLSWGLFLFLGYTIGLFKLGSGTIKHQLSRVPQEVLDYAIYLFIQDKSEDQVRTELSKHGWSSKDDQDSVFEAVAAVGSINEMRRS
jgi:hypothetical protein